MKSEKENEKNNLRSATEGDACQSKNEMGVAIGVDNEVIDKVLRRVAVGRDNNWAGRKAITSQLAQIIYKMQSEIAAFIVEVYPNGMKYSLIYLLK